MKTKDDCAIKGFLNQLFKRHRDNKWNSYDTTIAISYLIQSRFNHIDLLNVLSNRHPKLYEYYLHNCRESFIKSLDFRRVNELREVISQDSKALYLYFMYLCEIKRENYIAAFAYYKNYFDRVTADLNFAFERDLRLKKPNYKRFYKESSFISFYSGINSSEVIIKKAHSLRNANPLSHSSYEILESYTVKGERYNT